MTAFAFVASAIACDVLVCETGPSSPGLLFRTTMFRFRGLTWLEDATASACCVVGALCAACWDWPPTLPAPACVCVAPCATLFELPAIASATEEFVWLTGPLSPGLLTRTTMFTLVGACCVDVAWASASCFVGALWVDVCD